MTDLHSLIRATWLHLRVVPSEYGTSFDVVLSLDGHYANESDARGSAELLAQSLGLPLRMNRQKDGATS